MTSLEKLLKIASSSINPTPTLDEIHLPKVGSKLIQELQAILQQRNGFFAFENALLFFPMQTIGNVPGILDWQYAAARGSFRLLLNDVILFASDVFARQFGIRGDEVVMFDPETGEIQNHSENLDQWAAKILANYDFETGWSLAKAWQESNGPLEPGNRLLGKQPFVLGGDYIIENLKAVPITIAMKKMGALFERIRDLPDGSSVVVRDWIDEDI